MDLDDGITCHAADDPALKNELRRAWIADRLVYVLALLREVLAKSWQTTASTRLASVARDAFLPGGEADERAHVFAAVRFLLTSNL